ncbi:unnamed protein product [Effrenium voratum]|nr:unnamed protein product [Effrenium voratum]
MHPGHVRPLQGDQPRSIHMQPGPGVQRFPSRSQMGRPGVSHHASSAPATRLSSPTGAIIGHWEGSPGQTPKTTQRQRPMMSHAGPAGSPDPRHSYGSLGPMTSGGRSPSPGTVQGQQPRGSCAAPRPDRLGVVEEDKQGYPTPRGASCDHHAASTQSTAAPPQGRLSTARSPSVQKRDRGAPGSTALREASASTRTPKPEDGRLQFLESELASFTSKIEEMRAAAENLQEEVRTARAPSSAPTTTGQGVYASSVNSDFSSASGQLMETLKSLVQEEYGRPAQTSNDLVQEIRQLRQELRVEAEARKQLNVKMETMFLDEKKQRDEALRQMVHQREDADAKLEQRWHNTLKEESSLRRAVESHLEARLIALQRELRLEAGAASASAQQAISELSQLRDGLRQEMDAQKLEFGHASADLARLVEQLRSRSGDLPDISDNLVRAEVRRQLAERPLVQSNAGAGLEQALASRVEHLERALENEATSRQEESSKLLSTLHELVGELRKHQAEELGEFEQRLRSKLDTARVEEEQARNTALAKETKDREDTCCLMLKSLEEKIASETKRLEQLCAGPDARSHERELRASLESTVTRFVEKTSKELLTTRQDLLELREEMQEVSRSKAGSDGAAMRVGSSQQNGGDLERLMDGQTKLWASMDQVRGDLREESANRKQEIQRLRELTGPGGSLEVEELRVQLAHERIAREQGDDKCMENLRDLLHEEEKKRSRDLQSLELRFGRQDNAGARVFAEQPRPATTANAGPGVVAVSDRRAQTITTMRPGFKPPSFSA